MTPEARRTLWNICRRITESSPGGRSPERFRIFTEEQAGAEGFPSEHLRELEFEGFLSAGKVRGLTKKGLKAQLEHSNPRTRFKGLRRIVFDDLRMYRQQHPGSQVWTTYREEDCNELGVTADELELAQQELCDLGLFKPFGMNAGINSYALTDFGKQACAQESILDELIDGKRLSSPSQPTNVYHVSNHASVGQGQVFQNSGPGKLTVDQGDMNFGAWIPVDRQAELRCKLVELGAALDSEALPPADREDAQEALGKLSTELAKSAPDKSRVRRAIAAVNDTAEPFEKLANIAAQVIAMLQTFGLLT